MFRNRSYIRNVFIMENLFIEILEILIGSIKEEQEKKDKEKVERIWL